MRYTFGDYPKGNEKHEINVEIDSWDYINCDQMLAHVIIAALKNFKKKTKSHPCGYTFEQWQEILESMILGFQRSINSDAFDKLLIKGKRDEAKEWMRERDEGLDLFAKFFNDLWS